MSTDEKRIYTDSPVLNTKFHEDSESYYFSSDQECDEYAKQHNLTVEHQWVTVTTDIESAGSYDPPIETGTNLWGALDEDPFICALEDFIQTRRGRRLVHKALTKYRLTINQETNSEIQNP